LKLSAEALGEAIREGRHQITRRPDSIFGYALEDFAVRDYAPQAHLAAPVAV